MNRAQMETKNEALRSHIRCAKSAWILYSLNKSSADRQFKTRTTGDQDEVKDLMLLKELEVLKIRVVKERMKNKRIKLCGTTEAILQFLVAFFSFLGVVLMLAFSIGLI